MDICTFTASASALAPYLSRCVALGQQTQELSPEETFARLRRAGIRAEQDMFQATGGINTHKGAIFTMGTVCGAIGRLWNAQQPCRDLAAILNTCAQMTQCAIDTDFREIERSSDGSLALTTGQRLYLHQGIKGIRGELAAGLPSVSHIGIPVLRRALAAGKDYNDAAAIRSVVCHTSIPINQRGRNLPVPLIFPKFFWFVSTAPRYPALPEKPPGRDQRSGRSDCPHQFHFP